MRLAQGQIRIVVADHADRAPYICHRQGPREGEARHASDDDDEEDRHRGAGRGARGLSGALSERRARRQLTQDRIMSVADTQEFVFTRTLDAPRDLVWKAWTSAEALGQWWGPRGANIRVIKLDFRPGGMFHYAMAFQPGHDMYGRFVYREMVAPDRLGFVNSFSDADCGIPRAPFPQLKGKWP